MNANSLKVRTRHEGGIVESNYTNASWKVEGAWLLITHDDLPTTQKCLSRVPMANVFQVVEIVPEVKQ